MTAPTTHDTLDKVSEARLALEAPLFAFLQRKYAQRADDRQAEMGLVYTEAETHDLAKTVAQFVLSLRTTASLPPRSGGVWQLIETAPKDGTLIDLFGTRSGEPHRFCNAAWAEVRAWGTGQGTGEYRWQFANRDIYGEFEFSHWMPLPAPPRSTLADPIPEAPADEEVEGLAQALRNLVEGAEQEDRTILYKAAAALRRSTETDKPGVREGAATDGFAASDFADVAARMVKFDLGTDQYQAVMSNCFNVILAALNRAALRTSPPASPTEAGEATE